MTYSETIDWLYNRLPMFSRIGAAAYKKDLHNTIALCDIAGNPQTKFPSIHIAGTNGKGSTSHMLAAILQQAGYKTGLYTSPHIHDFRERIRVNGEMISESFICSFVEEMRQACAEIEPSFFELTVVMAFGYFVQQQVDVAVIETGLGGRLDSTNLVSPQLSVITNIGFDHMALLGNTLPLIAAEKAGIIKRNTPVLIGEYQAETAEVFRTAAADKDAPILFSRDLFEVSEMRTDKGMLSVTVTDKRKNKSSDYLLDLPGHYQAKNLCTVLASVDILRNTGYDLPEEKVLEALRQVRQLTGLQGRWQKVASHPDVILDVAHNEDGIRQVLSQLRVGYPGARRHFVMGVVQDKDLAAVLKQLSPDDRYYFTQAHIPRAMPHEQLKETAEAYGIKGDSYEDVNKAVAAARANASAEDVIMVCGSFFVIAEWKDDQSG